MVWSNRCSRVASIRTRIISDTEYWLRCKGWPRKFPQASSRDLLRVEQVNCEPSPNALSNKNILKLEFRLCGINSPPTCRSRSHLPLYDRSFVTLHFNSSYPKTNENIMRITLAGFNKKSFPQNFRLRFFFFSLYSTSTRSKSLTNSTINVASYFLHTSHPLSCPSIIILQISLPTGEMVSDVLIGSAGAGVGGGSRRSWRSAKIYVQVLLFFFLFFFFKEALTWWVNMSTSVLRCHLWEYGHNIFWLLWKCTPSH